MRIAHSTRLDDGVLVCLLLHITVEYVYAEFAGNDKIDEMQ